ncbi:hypothetical protein GCM10010919_14430 [Alishewanella longhuensis]|uniref:Uncharacterized protein n=1 Tax=Alishewanella longhuensis TaxID=1091037 RepID=A0ABQ3KWP4_9ALTE|nr:hypothetical protein GCM10010919_14430 [Alishewanella longhuensis]
MAESNVKIEGTSKTAISNMPKISEFSALDTAKNEETIVANRDKSAPLAFILFVTLTSLINENTTITNAIK